MRLNLSRRNGLLCLTLTTALFVLFGCSTKENSSDASPAASAPGAAASPATTSPAAGAPGTATGGDATKIYATNCKGCHAINGEGGKKGPDLTHTGAEKEHTAQWLAEFIKNPKSKDPGSRMPGFEGRITDADLTTLSTYLASLK